MNIASDSHIMKCNLKSRTLKQMRQPRLKKHCCLHGIREFPHDCQMPGDSLREETSVMSESSKGEVPTIAQKLYLYLCVS